MTQSQEFNAGTVDEAVEKAATALGVPADDLSYEVVDTGSEGFLGIGARDARILVESAGTSSSGAGVLDDDDDVAPPPTDEAGPEYDEPPDVNEPPDVHEPPEVEAPTEDVAPAPAPDLSEVYGGPEDAEDVEASEELLGDVRQMVGSVLDAMGFDARIDVYDANGFIAVDVASDSTALFIGQKGETIDALQYLVNAAVYRRQPFVKRIVLDAEGYRQRRVEAIQGIAHRTARRALRERRPVELPPMSPSERRIVHIYLRDNPGVTTASEGAGDNRRVRVSPA